MPPSLLRGLRGDLAPALYDILIFCGARPTSFSNGVLAILRRAAADRGRTLMRDKAMLLSSRTP